VFSVHHLLNGLEEKGAKAGAVPVETVELLGQILIEETLGNIAEEKEEVQKH